MEKLRFKEVGAICDVTRAQEYLPPPKAGGFTLWFCRLPPVGTGPDFEQAGI